MRQALLPLLLLAAAGCEGGTGGPPDTGPHAYLLFDPASERTGWNMIEALRAELPPGERGHIRTAGLVSSAAPTMYVDFDGTCNGGFMAAARPIARKAGTPTLTCATDLPPPPNG